MRMLYARRFLERFLISLFLATIVAAIEPIQAAGQPTENLFALNQEIDELIDKGKYAEALPRAERALALAEKRFGVDGVDLALLVGKLVFLYAKEGQGEEALALLNRGAAIFGRDKPAMQRSAAAMRPTISKPALSPELNTKYRQLGSQGIKAAKNREFDRAIAAFDRLIAIVPNEVRAYHFRGVAYSEKGEYERALDDYDKAIAIDSNFSKTYIARAQTYFKWGKPKEGLPDAEHAVLMVPNNSYFRHTRAQIYAALGRREEAIWDLQLALLFKGGKQESRDALTKLGVSASLPSWLDALKEFVDDHYAQGKYAEAIPIAQRLLAMEEAGSSSPALGVMLNNLAALYVKQERSRDALQLLRRAQAVRDALAHANSTSPAINPKISMPALSQVLKEKHTGFWSQGREAFGKNEFDRVIETSDKLLAIVPNDVEALFLRGSAYFDKGDYERAVADFSRAIGIDPNYAFAHMARAWTYSKWGKANEGLPDAERAVQLAPNNPVIRDVRGRIYAALGRREDAIWDLKQALFLSPGSQETVDALKQLGVTPIPPPRVKPFVDIVPRLGHVFAVSSFAFSPDGAQLLTGSSDRTAKLWDLATGALLRTFRGHSAGVTSVAFSPDGMYALTGSSDNTAKLWRADSAQLITTFAGHVNDVVSVAFSHEGARVLTGSSDSTAKLWDATTGAMLQSVGQQDVSDQSDDSEIGTIVFVVPVSETAITSVTFSPDGDRFLTGGRDKIAKLWDVVTGELLKTFAGHGDGVTSVTFSPDGTKVLTGSLDKTSKLWEIGTGELLRTFTGHSDEVTSVAFSPDGARILTGSQDRTAKLWDVATAALLRTLKGHSDRLTTVTFLPNGTRVLTGSQDRTAKLWDVATGALLRTLRKHSEGITSVAFSSDGASLLTGSEDHIAKLWDVATGALLRAFRGHANPITSVAFSPDGAQLLTGSADHTAKLWDAQTGKLLRTLEGHADKINSVAFSPDGTRVLTGGEDSITKIWDAATGALLSSLTGHASAVSSAVFSPDGARLLTGGDFDGMAKLWDATTGTLLKTIAAHGDEVVASVAFSPDGTRVLTGSNDGTVKLLDLSTGELLKTFAGHSWWVTSVAFSPDGSRVLTGSEDKTAKLWDVEAGQLIGTFRGHTDDVTSISFSPDGTRVMTGSADATVKIWDARTGEPLATMFADNKGAWLTTTPAGFFAGSNLGRDGDKMLAVVRGVEPYSVTQFFEHLYNPKLVAQRLKGDPERKYKNAASKLNLKKILNSGNPPEIQTLPGKKTELIGESVRVTVRLVDDWGGIGDKVVWRVNGVTKEISRRDKTEDKSEPWLVSETLSVNPHKKNIIEVTAYNGAGLLATRPFRFEVDKFGTSTEEEPRPTMYVLALGVSDYVRDDWDLTYAKSDAETIGARLKRAAKDLYEDVEVTVLKDSQVTHGGIEAAFETLKGKVKPTDVFVLFVAGHGRNVTEKYYFIPHDLTFEGGKSVEDGIGQDTWQSWLKLIDAEKSILIFDTCESSAVAGLTRGEQERETAVDRLRHATGRSIITAARQAAYEGYKGHGVLTWSILDALTGNKPEEVDLYQLAAHVDRKVPEITKSLFGVRQRPHNKIEGNFPIGVRLGLATTTDSVPATQTPTTPTHVVIRSERVRAEPEKEAAGERQLTPGAKVSVVKVIGDWAVIARDGQPMGYVPLEALAKMH